MKRTPINKISKKQQALEAKRAKVKAERINYLVEKYGFSMCEYCGKAGPLWGGELNTLDMHEIDGNHRNLEPDNVYIIHRKCHTYITDHNIQVSQEDFQSRKFFI